MKKRSGEDHWKKNKIIESLKEQIFLSRTNRSISGTVHLAGSKSISNRVLIIRALCDQPFEIFGLATSKDTQTLINLLKANENVLDAGAAGTTFRFLTAYLAQSGFSGVLTGSERMKQRPIGELVNALNSLGAKISYLDKTGFPPLQFNAVHGLKEKSYIRLSADISSQFISALLLIAPTLPHGLEIELEGKIVSRPYLMMTLHLMEVFGVEHSWNDQIIEVLPQKYVPTDYTVEADWSAASYYYSIAALSDTCDIRLKGLFEQSIQGDQAISKIMESLGVNSRFQGDLLHLHKENNQVKPVLKYDFIECPDLAQTVIVACAGLNVEGRFTGLETLFIKETDRVHAMQLELNKVGCNFGPETIESTDENAKAYYTIEGNIHFENDPILFDTYEDHRMAMALAPLSLLHPITINDPHVVIKSYPAFWEDIKSIGFRCE